MDKNRIIGSAKRVEGAINDAKLQVEGKAEKAEGKAQNLLGSLKDTLKP